MSGQPNIPHASLPVGQLESTRFKITQMMESITALQRTVEQAGQNAMPAWPDILAKYNVLLSQTHNLSMSLVSAPSSSHSAPGIDANKVPDVATKPFAKLALQPANGLSDAQLDNDFAPLLRNQQTTEVLRIENETVRRLAERLPTAAMQKERPTAPETYTTVLKACDIIKMEHDARCDRAMRAVSLLREKYDWKERVRVEIEEPEEFIPLSPSPFNSNRMSPVPPFTGSSLDGDMTVDAFGDGVNGVEESDDSDGDDAEELEEVLGPSLRPSPGSTPGQDESIGSTPS